MAIEKLLTRIEKDAKKEVDEVIEAAEQEAKKIIKEAKEEGKREAERIAEKGKREAERRKERILSAARREARMVITNAKEEIIQKCFAIINEKISSMPARDYRKVMEKMVKEAMEEGGTWILHPSRKEDTKIAEKFGVEMGEGIDAIGGVILRAKDGSREIDLTFDFLLERKREEIRIMIAEKLFENVD